MPPSRSPDIDVHAPQHGRLALVARCFSDEQAFPHASLALQTLVGLALFGVVERLFFACSRLPEEVYHARIICLAALKHPAPLTAVVVSLALLGFWRQLRWQQFELYRPMRWAIAALALTLGFAFSTYGYNFFYDQAHWFDRALVAGLALLVVWHPAMVGLFVVQAFLIAGQFNQPLLYSWTDKMMVYQLLVLLVPFLWLKLVCRRLTLAPYLVAALGVIAIFYFRPALGKIEMGWMAHNSQANIFLAAVHQNGWLAWLGPDRLRQVYLAIDRWQYVLMTLTLLVETAVLFYLIHPRLTAAVLIGCVLMHGGIFLTSGICFWKWAVADVAFAAAILALPREAAARIFNWRGMALGIMIVLGLQVTYRHPVKLAWYDSPMAFHFQVEAVGASGAVYEIPPYCLAPYDLPLAQGRLYFLARHVPQVVNTLGAVYDPAVLKSVGAAHNRRDLLLLRSQYGQRQYNARIVASYEQLVRRYCAWRWREHETGIPWHVKGPPHIWSFARYSGGPVYQGQEQVREVRVRLDEAFIDDGRIKLIASDQVHTFSTDRDAIADQQSDRKADRQSAEAVATARRGSAGERSPQ